MEIQVVFKRKNNGDEGEFIKSLEKLMKAYIVVWRSAW